ncbi:hypothetical protein K504DRAFT_448282 [Pleomassaria siparia CBS 279.74]|uniref:Uncharacterized protein n=1 Tax=Pleomassaria siparia CBS 279.74 TaxID=1314801 RepID=A0A6G1JZ00_9PLEO|nr:hypothetical protein K504DRAFT_448282 [Pleomassaria siparia CBS 279.74]
MQGDRRQQRAVAIEKRQTSNLRNRKIASIAKRVNINRGTVITLRKKLYISAFKLLTLLLFREVIIKGTQLINTKALALARAVYGLPLRATILLIREEKFKLCKVKGNRQCKFLVVDLKEESSVRKVVKLSVEKVEPLHRAILEE